MIPYYFKIEILAIQEKFVLLGHKGLRELFILCRLIMTIFDNVLPFFRRVVPCWPNSPLHFSFLKFTIEFLFENFNLRTNKRISLKIYF